MTEPKPDPNAIAHKIYTALMATIDECPDIPVHSTVYARTVKKFAPNPEDTIFIDHPDHIKEEDGTYRCIMILIFKDNSFIRSTSYQGYLEELVMGIMLDEDIDARKVDLDKVSPIGPTTFH